MGDYVLLYSGGSMPETDEERAKVMDAWTSWFEGLGAAIKDGGNPFSGQSKTVATDGSVSQTGGALAGASGYSILQADSVDSAVALAKDCPVLEGNGTITVYETFAVM